MKLRPCNSCGTLLALSAASCPQCGSTTCNSDLRKMEKNMALLSKPGWKVYAVLIAVFLVGVYALMDAIKDAKPIEMLYSVILAAVPILIFVLMRLTLKSTQEKYQRLIDSFPDGTGN